MDKTIFKEELTWNKTGDKIIIYQRVDKNWKIRLNNFPENSLYTLLVEDQEVLNFDDWPEYWDII